MWTYSSTNWLRSVAVGSLTAFAVCLVLSAEAIAATLLDGKTRNQAERALREGEYELAEKIYRELLNKDALDNQARLGLSFALLKQRRLQDAYDHAARVISADPLSAKAHALLGTAVLASGDFRNSIQEFRTALSIDADEPVAIAGVAMIDFYENRLTSAVRGLRRAASIAPREPDYIFNLGQAAARSERYKEAANAYDRFLAVAPKTDADRRARIRGLIDFLRYLGKQGSLYVPSGASRTVVSFESTDYRPVVLVRVNDAKLPLRFVLDTGSGMSVISEQTAKRLGLRPVARGGLARAVGGGGRFEIVYGFLSSLQIGEVKVESVPVYIRHFYDDKNPVDGYLGLSVISKFVTAIDYGERTFTLMRQHDSDDVDGWKTVYRSSATQPSTAPDGDAIEIPLRTTSSGFLSGEVYLEGLKQPLNFIIDTGASVSVVSEKLAEREEISRFAQRGRMRVYGAAGIAEEVKTLLLPRVILGTLAREKISAAVLDLEPVNETAGFTQNGILGANFLKHYRVWFDFQRGVIRLMPLNKTARSIEGSKPEQM
jgi:tetratricopeptide (TPR) repeat protein